MQVLKATVWEKENAQKSRNNSTRLIHFVLLSIRQTFIQIIFLPRNEKTLASKNRKKKYYPTKHSRRHLHERPIAITIYILYIVLSERLHEPCKADVFTLFYNIHAVNELRTDLNNRVYCK